MAIFDRFLQWLGTHSTTFNSRGAATHRIVREELPLASFEPLGVDLTDSALQFWFDNCQGSAPPDWSCFRPEKHPAMLPKVVLYEVVEGRFVMRIIGDTIRPHLPKDSTGRSIEDVVAEDRLPDVKMRLERAVSDGLPNYVEKLRLWQQGREAYGYNALSMPFTSRNGGPDRVLCLIDLNVEVLNSDATASPSKT